MRQMPCLKSLISSQHNDHEMSQEDLDAGLKVVLAAMK